MHETMRMFSNFGFYWFRIFRFILALRASSRWPERHRLPGILHYDLEYLLSIAFLLSSLRSWRIPFGFEIFREATASLRVYMVHISFIDWLPTRGKPILGQVGRPNHLIFHIPSTWIPSRCSLSTFASSSLFCSPLPLPDHCPVISPMVFVRDTRCDDRDELSNVPSYVLFAISRVRGTSSCCQDSRRRRFRSSLRRKVDTAAPGKAAPGNAYLTFSPVFKPPPLYAKSALHKQPTARKERNARS